MSHLDLDDGVLYPRGGFTEVIRAIERLAVARGVGHRTGVRGRRDRTTDAIAVATGVAPRGRPAHRRRPRRLHRRPAPHRDRAAAARAADLPREVVGAKRTPSPGALLLLLGVEGELPQLAHHTLLFAEDWSANFDDIFGEPSRIPDPASLYVCRPSATDPHGRPARAREPLRARPGAGRSALGRGGVDGDGDAAVETAADRVIAADLATWCGIPDLADRIVVRRTIAPGDFAADLHAWRGNALGLAHTLGQSAVFRPRNASRKVDGLSYAGGIRAPRDRTADVPDLRRARAQAAARRPHARPAARAGQGVTCRDSTCLRSSSRPAASRCSMRASGSPRGGPAAHGRGRRDRHRVLPALGCGRHRHGRLPEGRQSPAHRHRPRTAAAARGAVLPRVPLLPRPRRLGGRAARRHAANIGGSADARLGAAETSARRDLPAHRHSVRRGHRRRDPRDAAPAGLRPADGGIRDRGGRARRCSPRSSTT